MANIYSNAGQEVLDMLEDKVASLKAAGRMKEAAEADKELARQMKRMSAEDELGAFAPKRTTGATAQEAIPEGTPAPEASPVNKVVKADAEPLPASATQGLSGDELLDARAKARMENRPLKDVVAEMTSAKAPMPGMTPYDASFDPTKMQRPEMNGVPGGDVDFTGSVPSSMKPPKPGTAPFTSGQGFSADAPEAKNAMGMKKAAGLTAGAGLVGAGALSLFSDKEPGQPAQPQKKPSNLMAEAEAPPLAEGSGSSSSRPQGFIPYRKVRNYLEDLGEAPTADYSDLSQRFDANQQKVEMAAEKVKGQIDALMAANNVLKDGVKKQELAEKIVNAVGLMAAGLYGLNTGSDLSGVKFNTTDWDGKLRNLSQDLSADLSAVKEKYGVDMDSLNKERQRLGESKQERNAQYEMAYKKWQNEGQRLNNRTNYEQEERNYQDSLNRWNDEMIARAQRSAASGKDVVENLTKERESELDKKMGEWTNTASSISKIKDSDAKAEAVGKLQALDQQITQMRGYSMVPNPKVYKDADSGFFSSNYEQIIQANAKQQQNIEKLRQFPRVNSVLAQQGTFLRQKTMQLMQSGLSLRDADAEARRAYAKVLTQAISQAIPAPAAKK